MLKKKRLYEQAQNAYFPDVLGTADKIEYVIDINPYCQSKFILVRKRDYIQ